MMRTVREPVPKIVIAVVATLALVRVATAKPQETGKPITAAQAHEAYRDVTSRERTMRRDAAVKFPGDPWSQDDDFHERENEEMRSFASSKEIRLSDVLGAVDQGMREHWPTTVIPNPKVPPCRPRLSY